MGELTASRHPSPDVDQRPASKGGNSTRLHGARAWQAKCRGHLRRGFWLFGECAPFWAQSTVSFRVGPTVDRTLAPASAFDRKTAVGRFGHQLRRRRSE